MKKVLHGGKTASTLGVLFLTWLVILAGHMFAGMYADDYFYASGGFAWEADAEHYAAVGLDNLFRDHIYPNGRFSLQNLGNFLYYHYMIWGGRVIPFALEALCLQVGPRFFFFIQSLLMAGTFFLGAKIAGKTLDADLRTTLLGMLALYAVSGLDIFREGYYWASASIHYIWPMPALLGGYYLLIARRENPRLPGAAALLFLFAAACNEILGAMILALLGANLLVNIAAKQHDRIPGDVLCLLAGAAGFAFAVLAPGNFVRAAYSPMQFTPSAGYLLTQAGEAARWLARALWPMNGIMLVTGIALFYFSVLALVRKKSSSILPITAAWLAIFCIYIMRDARSFRTTIPQFMLSAAFASAFIIHILEKIFARKYILVLLLLFACSMYPYARMTRQYAKNYPVLVENDRILRNYEGEGAITLYRLRKNGYSGPMPYEVDPNISHIDYFMKRFYHLPRGVTFQWLPAGDLPHKK